MLDSTECSALEDVAAFAEGRLRGAERDRVIAHLAECADCREVLAETVKTAEELDAEDNPRPISEMRPEQDLRPRRSPWLVRGAALAATLALATSVVIWQLDAQRSPPSPDRWLAQMPPASDLAPHVWGGVRLRGGGGMSASTPQATELGALLVDVAVTVRAGDVERAADALHRMATILDEAGFMDEHVATLRAIANEGDGQRMKAALEKALPEIDDALRERFEPAFLDLGTFAEEAQVAASAGNRGFLGSRASRRYLNWVLSRPRVALPLESSADSAPLPDTVIGALRTLRNEAASLADQAAAAQTVLDTLSR